METQAEGVTLIAEKRRLRRFLLNLGKLVLDATKLIFASLVLGTVIKGEIPPATLMVVGIIASSAGAIIGLTFTTIYEEK